MPIAPVSRLKKDEIIWLAAHRCRHHHTYLEHFSCYIDENPDKGKIGFLDIETSNLAANFGIMYCYCIYDPYDKVIYERVILDEEIKSKSMDKNVVKQCIEDLSKFDKVITYYGTRFDLPFIRSRAIYHGLDFPSYGEILHTDLYFLVRNKFKLNSNRLATACEFLLGKSNKTKIDFNSWIRAMGGDKESLDYIIKHCRYDVLDLEMLYNKIIPYKKRLDISV